MKKRGANMENRTVWAQGGPDGKKAVTLHRARYEDRAPGGNENWGQEKYREKDAPRIKALAKLRGSKLEGLPRRS